MFFCVPVYIYSEQRRPEEGDRVSRAEVTGSGDTVTKVGSENST